MKLDDLDPKPVRRSILGGLRTSFLTGLVVIMPVFLTGWIIWTLAGWIDAWVLPFVPERFQLSNFTEFDIRGFGVIIFLFFAVFIGWMAKGLMGRSLISWAEGIVEQLPVVRSVYRALKQILETVFSQSENSFEQACLVEYPRRGIWCIAFISTTAKGEIERVIPRDDELVSIFLPTTPNPTSGFLLFVPRSDLIELEMNLEDSAKLIISAGLVYPDSKTAKEAAEKIVSES